MTDEEIDAIKIDHPDVEGNHYHLRGLYNEVELAWLVRQQSGYWSFVVYNSSSTHPAKGMFITKEAALIGLKNQLRLNAREYQPSQFDAHGAHNPARSLKP